MNPSTEEPRGTEVRILRLKKGCTRYPAEYKKKKLSRTNSISMSVCPSFQLPGGDVLLSFTLYRPRVDIVQFERFELKFFMTAHND